MKHLLANGFVESVLLNYLCRNLEINYHGRRKNNLFNEWGR